MTSGPPFSANDPFPLLPHDAYSLAEAQRHAREADAWIGLRTEEIESELALRAGKTQGSPESGRARMLGDVVEDWVGLPVQTMLTPYLEIRSLLHELAPEDGSGLVDLGAGYGRMAWVVARHFPSVRFTGYELVSERVQESLRCLTLHHPQALAAERIRMIQADLSEPRFSLPEADAYFMYDFGSRIAIEKTLQDLRQIAGARRITVVARGRSSRDAIERSHPWLSEIVPPRHLAHFSIYRSA